MQKLKHKLKSKPKPTSSPYTIDRGIYFIYHDRSNTLTSPQEFLKNHQSLDVLPVIAPSNASCKRLIKIISRQYRGCRLRGKDICFQADDGTFRVCSPALPISSYQLAHRDFVFLL
ncbi:hypothetical protein GGI15_003626 [Coemansia interrupta]|uniref:Uncharacterized protein n=1 Tax=Coemansia interrupta TaxID=1126814 RepID=A0A9W8LG31_9FUNG|nr:hypothetical protein GGI15_003626 [Coemansia interrupta]